MAPWISGVLRISGNLSRKFGLGPDTTFIVLMDFFVVIILFLSTIKNNHHGFCTKGSKLFMRSDLFSNEFPEIAYESKNGQASSETAL